MAAFVLWNNRSDRLYERPVAVTVGYLGAPGFLRSNLS